MTREKVPQTVKVAIGGHVSVGKTTIVDTLKGQLFKGYVAPTIGSEYNKINISISPIHSLTMEIFDLGGQERFTSITDSYYRTVEMVILVFSLNSRETWHTVKRKYEELKVTNRLGDKRVIFVGNKLDSVGFLGDGKFDPYGECENYAESKGCQYIEVSAKTGENMFELKKILIDSFPPEDVSEVNELKENVSIENKRNCWCVLL